MPHEFRNSRNVRGQHRHAERLGLHQHVGQAIAVAGTCKTRWQHEQVGPAQEVEDESAILRTMPGDAVGDAELLG
jgi:hypothetical protein